MLPFDQKGNPELVIISRTSINLVKIIIPAAFSFAIIYIAVYKIAVAQCKTMKSSSFQRGNIVAIVGFSSSDEKSFQSFQ